MPEQDTPEISTVPSLEKELPKPSLRAGVWNEMCIRDRSTTDIGEYLIQNLQELDKIAYVRFASVYRDFQDEEAFFNELKNLMRQKLP